jgi:hypothetical protein
VMVTHGFVGEPVRWHSVTGVCPPPLSAPCP